MAQVVHQILEALQQVKAEKVGSLQQVLEQDRQWLTQQVTERQQVLAKLRPRAPSSEGTNQTPAAAAAGDKAEAEESIGLPDKVLSFLTQIETCSNDLHLPRSRAPKIANASWGFAALRPYLPTAQHQEEACPFD